MAKFSLAAVLAAAAAAGLPPGTRAARPAQVYEQLAAAPHAPGFWDANPLRLPAEFEDSVGDRGRGAPKPPPPPGTHFAMCFTDNAILQVGCSRRHRRWLTAMGYMITPS